MPRLCDKTQGVCQHLPSHFTQGEIYPSSTHPLTHPSIHPLASPSTYPLTHPSTYPSSTHPLIYAFIQALMAERSGLLMDKSKPRPVGSGLCFCVQGGRQDNTGFGRFPAALTSDSLFTVSFLMR